MAARAAAKQSKRKADYKVTDNVVFEDVRIMFRNFKGEETPYNRAGNRNFCVVIDDEVFAERMKDDGWNVKILPPREEGDKPLCYIQVVASYKFQPPKVYLLTKTNKTLLDEDTIGELDDVDIESVDLIIRPYNWEVNGKSGVKAYLKSMYVKIREDFLAEKYANFGSDIEEEMDEDDLPF